MAEVWLNLVEQVEQIWLTWCHWPQGCSRAAVNFAIQGSGADLVTARVTQVLKAGTRGMSWFGMQFMTKIPGCLEVHPLAF